MLATAMVFVPLLAFAACALYVVIVFAAHYFLTLVECTAHGQRTVDWPKEAFLEWLGKPLHLGWLAGLYLLPAVLLAAWMGKVTGTQYVAVALVAVAFAMLFPIGALSAFIANSVWMPFHPKAIPLLLSKPATSLGFFAIGFGTCVLGLTGGSLAVFSKEIGWAGAPIGAVMMALAWFAYACALGRLLFALTYVAPPPRKKRKKKKPEPVESQPTEPEADPYWERPKPAWDQDRDDSPYAADAARVDAKVVHAEIAKPKESEMKLIAKDAPPPPPGNPFGPDAFAPMGQSETMRNAILLAIMFALLSGLVRMLIDMNPAK